MSFYDDMRELTRLVCVALQERLGEDNVMRRDQCWLTVSTGVVSGRETRFKVGFVMNVMWLTDTWDFDKNNSDITRVSCRKYFELTNPNVDPVEIVCERVRRLRKLLEEREREVRI